MRRLAGELGVGTMTLYSYFRSKDELLDAVVDVAAASTPEGIDLGGDWRQSLGALMREARARLTRHPGAIQMRRAGPLLSPGALRVTEAALQVLKRAGFSTVEATRAYRTLFLYTFGFAAFNTPLEPEELKRRTRAAVVALPPNEYPALTDAADEAADAMAGDEVFEFGLDRILDGLEALLTRSRG
jgi:AcrR family transcriptional regulator